MIRTIAAVTVAVVLGLPGVARASVVWTPASCAAGSFDAVSVDGQGHYLLPAHMALCEPFQARFNYSIVLFRGDGSLPLATGDKLQSYVIGSVTVDVLPSSPAAVFGVCLMRDEDTRVACVRVETAAGGVSSAPVAADDPLVADQVIFLTKLPVIQPNYCATCVTLTW